MPMPGSRGLVPVTRRNSSVVGDTMCGFRNTEPGFGDGVDRTGGVAIRGGAVAWTVKRSPDSRGGAGKGLSAGPGLREGEGASEDWNTGSSESPACLSFLRLPIKFPRLVLLEWPWELVGLRAVADDALRASPPSGALAMFWV